MTATPSIKIADAGERTVALRRARINSFVVRLMRWSLPACAVLLLASYALFMQHTIKVETDRHAGKLSLGTAAPSLDNLAMLNPSYEGYDKKNGSRYRVSAKKAITDLSRSKPVQLVGVDGVFLQANGRRTAVKASNGSFNPESGKLELSGGIQVDAPQGLSVHLKSATVDTKSSRISSNELVVVQLPAGEVRSNGLQLDQRARAVTFKQGVAATLQPPENGRDAPNSAIFGFGGGSKSPVKITSSTLSIAEKNLTALFEGAVSATQDGRTLEAPKLSVSFSGEDGAAAASEPGAIAGILSSGKRRMRQVVASDGVNLRDGSNKVAAQTAIFDVDVRKAELTGGVEISSAGGGAIKANHAEINTATNKVVLTGNVIASQANSLLRGSRLIYEPKIGRMRLTSTARKGAPNSGIFVRFRQSKAGRAKRRTATPANGLAFNTNPDAPIEITARALDIKDARSVARFDGGVRARQGDFTMKTPTLTAHYVGKIGLFNKPGEKRRARADRVKLRLIRAAGPVAVTSGGDLKAHGKRAEFDVIASKVTISGNVVLQRGRQIIRGDRLLIDLKTGLSRMKNAAPENNTAKHLKFGAPPRVTANPGQRDCGGQMCAVLFPQDAQKGRRAGRKNGRPARRVKPQTGSGWSASTRTSTN